MAWSQEEVISYVRNYVLSLKEEGYEINRALLMQKFFSELYPKVSDVIRRSEGMLDHLIAQGIKQGRKAEIRKPTTRAEVTLTQAEKTRIESKVKQWLSSQSILHTDARYPGLYSRAYDQLEEKTLEQKRKKLFPEAQKPGAEFPVHLERKPAREPEKPRTEKKQALPEKITIEQLLHDRMYAQKWMERPENKVLYDRYWKHHDPTREDAHLRAIILSTDNPLVKRKAATLLYQRKEERRAKHRPPLKKKPPHKPR